MKNLIYTFILSCFLALTANSQVPNPGFESWTSGEPDGWVTSNAPEAGLVNVVQSNDSHTGTYALRGEVVNFFGTPMACVIQSGPGGHGFPISQQYHSFECYYKFTSVGGDKFSVNVALKKSGNPIAQGAVALPVTVGTYTYLSVPLDYTTTETPDSAVIQISITGPVTGPDVHVGSEMIVDDFSLSLSTGTEDLSNLDLTAKVYPNPAYHSVTIPVPENSPGNITIKVFDTDGKEVKRLSGDQQQTGTSFIRFPVEDMPAGVYFYSLDGQNLHKTGKFTVAR